MDYFRTTSNFMEEISRNEGDSSMNEAYEGSSSVVSLDIEEASRDTSNTDDFESWNFIESGSSTPKCLQPKKKNKVDIDQHFSNFLGDVKSIIAAKQTVLMPSMPSTSTSQSTTTSTFIRLIEDKLTSLPIKERMEMEMEILNLLNNKILEINK